MLDDILCAGHLVLANQYCICSRSQAWRVLLYLLCEPVLPSQVPVDTACGAALLVVSVEV